MRLVFALLIALFPLASHAISARVITDAGSFLIQLWPDRAPATVDNFVKLAAGEIKFTEPDGKKAMRPFYNGLEFYRVNPDLGIFTGCPWNNGRGWPGYFIKEETNDLKFNQVGYVAMAEIKGDKQYGSQFFITTKAPLDYLNGEYTIFGQVTAGMEVVNKIANAPHNAREVPTKPVKIKTIEIVRD